MYMMAISPWMQGVLALLVVIAIFALIVAFVSWLYPKLKREKQGYPLETEIEQLLLPYIFQGIVAAYKVSDKAVDELGKRLDGVDRKMLADSIYALLPEKIGKYDVSMIKRLIPREQFSTIVQNVYDQAVAAYYQNAAYFDKLFDEWMKAQEDPALPPT